jgi:predicted DNA-binding protein (MmcQ/YjbR family)
VGGRGWIGVRLDRDVDWAEIAELCQDAYRVIAPARLAALLGDGITGRQVPPER